MTLQGLGTELGGLEPSQPLAQEGFNLGIPTSTHLINLTTKPSSVCGLPMLPRACLHTLSKVSWGRGSKSPLFKRHHP